MSRSGGKQPASVSKLDKAIRRVMDDLAAGDSVPANYLEALKLAIQWEGVKARVLSGRKAGSMFDDVAKEEADNGREQSDADERTREPEGDTESDD